MDVIKSKRRRTKSFSSRGNTAGYKRSNKKSKRLGSTIDPGRLVKEAVIAEEAKFVSSHTFDEMTINIKLKENIKNKGYTTPTQIQQESLAPLIAGRDLIGVAETGTGKTGTERPTAE